MGQHHEGVIKTLAPDTPAGRSYALARLLSHIFHPLILGVYSFLLLALYAVPDWRVGLSWATFGIVLQVVPPTIFFTIRMRQGAYSDEDVSVRQQRNELYGFSLLTLVAGLAILWLMQAPIPFLALLSSALLLTLSGWMINWFWKISVHASSAASCAIIALLYDPVLGGVLWLCALLVGWSRVRTRNHTPLQVVAGYGLAVVGVSLVFGGFGLL